MSKPIIPNALDDEYYLQDSRQVVGNDLLWWRKDHKGYTCNIEDAHVFTLAQALSHRDTDIPWPVAHMKSIAKLRVDHQYLTHGFKEQRKRLVFEVVAQTGVVPEHWAQATSAGPAKRNGDGDE